MVILLQHGSPVHSAYYIPIFATFDLFDRRFVRSRLPSFLGPPLRAFLTPSEAPVRFSRRRPLRRFVARGRWRRTGRRRTTDDDDDDDDDDAMRRDYSVDVGGSRGGETGARRCARARLTNESESESMRESGALVGLRGRERRYRRYRR